MINVNDNYTTIREAVNKKILSERDCVYAIYLLAIIVKKMLYDSKGGGHFNISPDTVLVLKKDEEDIKVRLLGDDNPHAACNGKPDFDTKELNRCCRAPESFLGRFSPATDVYSMGILLAYMLSGTYPYEINESMSQDEVLSIVKKNEPDLEMDLNIRLVIKKSISKVVTHRYKDAEELGFALMKILGMEKPSKFNCFSDVNKKKINEATNKERTKDDCDEQETLQWSKVPHVDVELTVKVGDGFKAVAGMEDIKQKLRRDFVEIVSHRELAKEFGIMPSNMLFYGAPGTGKTFISQKLAEECGLDFCSIKPSDLGSIWLHGSQGLIKELFQKAEAKAKKNKKGCILLIDEMDALCGDRSAKGNEHQADEVAEWLTQLNDCVEKNVFVIGTTNCLDRIDKAIIRSGRIDQVLYVGLPDEECRRQLFEIELNKRPHDTDIDIVELARITDGYTSSDISYMVKETARNAFEASIRDEGQGLVKISEAMLRDVVKSTRPSVSSDEVKRYEKMRDDFTKRNKNERPRIGFVA